MTRATKTPTAFRGQFLKELAKADRPGSVCVSGNLPLTMPGLEVDKVGSIRLAKDSRQHLHQMIDKCGCDLTSQREAAGPTLSSAPRPPRRTRPRARCSPGTAKT